MRINNEIVRLTSNPPKVFGNGIGVEFSVYTSRKEKDAWTTDYFDVVMFKGKYDRTPDPIQNLLNIHGKGVGIVLSGKLVQEEWQDQSGQKRTKHKIIASSVKSAADLAPRDTNNSSYGNNAQQQQGGYGGQQQQQQNYNQGGGQAPSFG